MLRDALRNLIDADPFEPFRIKLVNGDWFDVFDPNTAAVQQVAVYIASHDQNWAVIPIDKINSIESLMADYHGHADSADQP